VRSVAAEDVNQEASEVVWSESGGLSDLLGFDLAGEVSPDRSGLAALINSAVVAHRRMPVLDAIFDRSARRIAASLRQMTNENAEVMLDNVTSSRFGDVLAGITQYGVIGVMRAKVFNTHALMIADAALVHNAVDLLLGGRRSGGGPDHERALTPIERGLAQRMIEALVREWDEAFRPVFDAGFALERAEAEPRFAAIAQDASVCAIAKFKATIGERAGRLTIVAPYASIDPLREILSRDFVGESGRGNEGWGETLSDRVQNADVDVYAVLARRTMSIRELTTLARGKTLTFASAHEPRVALSVNGAEIGEGRVGRLGRTIAVRLNAPITLDNAASAEGEAA
jgi:flagellar motor switch protein FliM